jgi:hypothetical protein
VVGRLNEQAFAQINENRWRRIFATCCTGRVVDVLRLFFFFFFLLLDDHGFETFQLRFKRCDLGSSVRFGRRSKAARHESEGCDSKCGVRDLAFHLSKLLLSSRFMFTQGF